MRQTLKPEYHAVDSYFNYTFEGYIALNIYTLMTLNFYFSCS